MISRILSRLADWLTADARAEHEDTQQDDQPWAFRSFYRPTDGSDMTASARNMIPTEED